MLGNFIFVLLLFLEVVLYYNSFFITLTFYSYKLIFTSFFLFSGFLLFTLLVYFLTSIYLYSKYKKKRRSFSEYISQNILLLLFYRKFKLFDTSLKTSKTLSSKLPSKSSVNYLLNALHFQDEDNLSKAKDLYIRHINVNNNSFKIISITMLSSLLIKNDFVSEANQLLANNLYINRRILVPIYITTLIKLDNWERSLEFLYEVQKYNYNVDYNVIEYISNILYILANKQYLNNNYEKSLYYIKKSLSLKFIHSRTICLYASLLLIDYSEVEKAKSILLTNYANVDNFLFVKNYLYLSNKNGDDLSLSMKELLNIRPNDPYIYFFASLIALEKDMVDLSLSYIKKSIDISYSISSLKLFYFITNIKNNNLDLKNIDFIKLKDYEIYFCKQCDVIQYKWNYKCDSCDSFLSLIYKDITIHK